MPGTRRELPLFQDVVVLVTSGTEIQNFQGALLKGVSRLHLEVMLSGGSGKWRLGAFTQGPRRYFRKSSRSFRGFFCRFKEHNGLRIAAIHSTGALCDWNKAHPEKQVP